MLLKSQAHAERRLLAAGATLTVFGIAMSTGELASIASVLTLGGLLLVILGLHRFGRTGPDRPTAGGTRAVRTSARSKTKRKRARKTRSVPPEA
jgi:hypothetical protein